MGRRNKPKINSVSVTFSGDKTQFDMFMQGFINDYLNAPEHKRPKHKRPHKKAAVHKKAA